MIVLQNRQKSPAVFPVNFSPHLLLSLSPAAHYIKLMKTKKKKKKNSREKQEKETEIVPSISSLVLIKEAWRIHSLLKLKVFQLFV